MTNNQGNTNQNVIRGQNGYYQKHKNQQVLTKICRKANLYVLLVGT